MGQKRWLEGDHPVLGGSEVWVVWGPPRRRQRRALFNCLCVQPSTMLRKHATSSSKYVSDKQPAYMDQTGYLLSFGIQMNTTYKTSKDIFHSR